MGKTGDMITRDFSAVETVLMAEVEAAQKEYFAAQAAVRVAEAHFDQAIDVAFIDIAINEWNAATYRAHIAMNKLRKLVGWPEPERGVQQ